MSSKNLIKDIEIPNQTFLISSELKGKVDMSEFEDSFAKSDSIKIECSMGNKNGNISLGNLESTVFNEQFNNFKVTCSTKNKTIFKDLLLNRFNREQFEYVSIAVNCKEIKRYKLCHISKITNLNDCIVCELEISDNLVNYHVKDSEE